MRPHLQLVPFSSSSACGGMCLRNAPSCGTSTQSETSIPSHHQCLFSVVKTSIIHTADNIWLINFTDTQSEVKVSCCTRQQYKLTWHKSEKWPTKNQKVTVVKSSDLYSGCVWYLPARSDQSFPAMDVVHFLSSNPGPGLIIRRNGDTIFPTWHSIQTMEKQMFKYWNHASWITPVFRVTRSLIIINVENNCAA